MCVSVCVHARDFIFVWIALQFFFAPTFFPPLLPISPLAFFFFFSPSEHFSGCSQLIKTGREELES